jgi:transposase
LIGSRILCELRAAGYDGQRSAVDRVLAKLKAETPSSKVTERFETPRGQQAQFDLVAVHDRTRRRVDARDRLGMVLGDSRRKHYTASLDETQASIYEAIESCLRHLRSNAGIDSMPAVSVV